MVTILILCKKSRNFSQVLWGLGGWWIQICYLNFPGSQGSFYGNQIWTIMSQNCTDFSSMQEIKQFFAWIVRFSWSTNSNMLSKISREWRELPWQPNLGKIRTNCTEFSSVQEIEFFAQHVQNVSTFEVLRNHTLQINVYLVYLLTKLALLFSTGGAPMQTVLRRSDTLLLHLNFSIEFVLWLIFCSTNDF